jgi:predicted RND superfamily exporter protein
VKKADRRIGMGRDRYVDWLADRLIGWRHVLAAVFAAVTFFLGYNATKVQLDPGFLKLIPVQHPYMRTMMEYARVFPGANRILVSLHWKGEGDIYNPEFMDALRRATDDVFFIPGMNRIHVSSIFTPNNRYTEVVEDGFKGAPIVPAEFSATPAQLAQVRSNVEHSGLIGQLVANDQKSAMIQGDLQDYDPETGGKIDYFEIIKRLDRIRATYTTGNVEANVIGFPKLIGDVMKGLFGVFIFFNLAFVVTMLLLYLYSRSIRLTLAALVVALLPVLWLLGVLPLIGFGVDPMSILVPFLIFSIGVSHAVQMTNAWRQEVVAGASAVEASHAAFRKLFIPGAVALVTNALGFAVIMVIDIPIVRELGITACLGVLLMVITNKMALPILLTHIRLEEKSRSYTEMRKSKGAAAVWIALSRCAQPRYALYTFLACLLTLAVATGLSRKLVIGDLGRGAPELRPNAEFNRDIQQISSSYDIGADVLSVIVEAKNFEGDSCLHYPVMNTIDRLESFLRGVAGVQSVASVADTAKIVISAFNEGNPRWRALSRSEAGMSVGSAGFDPALGLNNESCRAIQIAIFTKDHEGATIAHVVSEIKRYIATNPPPSGIAIRLGSGNVGVMAAQNEAVANAEVKMLLAIFGALSLLCLLTFRSLTAVVCVMAPLTMVSIFCNALMASLHIGLVVTTLPVIALGVGVGVDYGIYIFERIQRHMHFECESFHEAFLTAMLERGTAAVFTAVTMSVAVGTWTLSALKFQADMGLLLSFMFLVNMLGAICVLPALGAWFFRRDRRKALA